MTTPIIKNLLHVVRRFKLATILNVLGLSVAFAAFMLIMIHLHYHFTFDRFHENSDKIFRMEIVRSSGDAIQPGDGVSRPLNEAFIASSPHIISGARISSWRGRRAHFSVERNGEHHYFQAYQLRVTSELPDVFSLDLVEGTKNALQTEESAIIPLSLSHRLFGYESAIGRHLTFSWGFRTVTGVYRDFPSNSVLNNYMFIPFPEEQNIDQWGNNLYAAFIRVNDASNVPVILENFNRMLANRTLGAPDYFFEWNPDISIRLTALPDLHFLSDIPLDPMTTGNRQTLLVLLAIGIVILIIAVINFTNFSTALMPMRVRNINTQRVFGAQQHSIRLILVVEAVAFCVVSFLASLLLVKLFGDSPLVSLVSGDLSLATNLLVVGGTALVVIVVGIVAGLYPSRSMTSFAPAMALKGNFGLSPKGKKLRNTLIGIQFIASFVLIIGTSFMYLQNRFMQQSDLGYRADALITVDINQILQSRDAFTHRLREIADIENVTYANNVLTSADWFMSWGRSYKGEQIGFQVISIQYDFLRIMGIEITAGRDFRREDAGAELGAFIFNETARQQYSLEANTMIDGWGEIVGFMPNIKFNSSRMGTAPMAFYVWGTNNVWGDFLRYAYIQVRSGANLRTAMAHVRSVLAEFDPNYPFEVRFHEEVLQQLYEDEIRLSLLITIFSLIAILISIVGVFGLVVFDSEYRRKEIGIRKVHGASTLEIITMFNKSYLTILLICFVIAVPIAWIAVSRWLENFAYRTPMYWWVYLLAFLVVAVITVLTVTIQNWRVANEDPVKLVKTE